MQRDSIANTIVVALLLCIACSLLVSFAYVNLRETQETNMELYRKKNVLLVTGLTAEDIASGGVEKLYEDRVETLIVDLRTGADGRAELIELMRQEAKDPGLSEEAAIAKFHPQKVAKKAGSALQAKELATSLSSSEDVAGIGSGRENFQFVYKYKADESAEPIWVFPVRGRGLWSTLVGFLALKDDLQTVAGITFFEHGETPGLGGEIENPVWKEKWPGQKVYDDQGNVALKVVKGSAGSDDQYGIDGLSGATITSNGVSNIVEFWMGPEGYGKMVEAKRGTGAVKSKAAAMSGDSSRLATVN